MSEYLNKRVMPFGRRTSAARAGVMEISLPHGARVAMLANLLAPDHDRGLWEAILRYLSFYKPHLIIFVGRIIHARVVNLLDPDSFPFSEDEAPLAPELKAALDSSNIWEERVGELFRILGESIFKRIVEAAGDQCRLYFLPALDGGSARDLPPEGLIQELLYRIQKKVDRNRARELRQKLRQKARRQEESDEPDAPEDEEIYPPIPMLRKEFAKLLQIDDHPQIDVLPFGSMIELKCQVGDPASASDDAARAACSKVLTDVRVE